MLKVEVEQNGEREGLSHRHGVRWISGSFSGSLKTKKKGIGTETRRWFKTSTMEMTEGD